MTVQAEKQKLSMDNVVTLFQLDTTPIGGTDIYYFTNSVRPGGASVMFDGIVYTPIAVTASGFGYDGSGSFPSPKLQISNVMGWLTSAVIAYKDFIGAKLIRIRTFETFLDDGATPDPEEIFPVDTFTVEQKTNHNKIYIEWRLSSIIDETDRLLPGRVILRNFCPFIYRQWDAVAVAFNYDKATCPYTGSNYFDEDDKASSAANDKCGKTLASCSKRFGARKEIKFGGFPGVGRDRTY
jgi:lambda family phage minor tail protein L